MPPGWTPPLADPPPPARTTPPPPHDRNDRPQDDMTLPEEVRVAFRHLDEDLKRADRHLRDPLREM
jgi:hypothetical protein